MKRIARRNDILVTGVGREHLPESLAGHAAGNVL